MNESLRPPCPNKKDVVTARFRTRTGTVQETDLDSVVGTILAKTKLWWGSEETINEWICNAYSDAKKTTSCRKVSNLYHLRETDFDSVVITTWVRPVKMNLRRNYPWMNVNVVFDNKKLIAGMFRKCATNRNRFWFCCGNHLDNTTIV
jgi:hypothetical protein